MRFSKQLFYDEVNDNWRKSKFMAKNKNRRRPVERGRIKVTPDEVIEKLKKLEVDTTRRTLLNYEKWGLVPEAVRGGAGKGKGRTTDYPDETPAEFYASIKLKSVYGLKVAVIARCREKGLRMEKENNGLGLAEWFDEPLPGDEVDANGAVISKYLFNPKTMQEAGFGQTWLKEKHRVLHHGQHEGCLVCQNLNVE